VTRMVLDDRLRNPWGILHGGAVAMLADEAACRAWPRCRARRAPRRGGGRCRPPLPAPGPGRPVEARCSVLGTGAGRTLVRVAIHDLGSEDRMTNLGTITVLAV